MVLMTLRLPGALGTKNLCTPLSYQYLNVVKHWACIYALLHAIPYVNYGTPRMFSVEKRRFLFSTCIYTFSDPSILGSDEMAVKPGG